MTRMIFTARPLRVEAWQWDGTPAAVRAFNFPGARVERLSKSRGLIVLIIIAKEWLCMDPGDWLVRGHDGVIFVEPGDQFAGKYQQQEELACLP